mgnify:CR=1 FL=1
MRNFKNNFRRNRYKNYTDRNSLKNDNGSKIINNLQNGSNFIRKNSGRNNHNAPKLIEKYNDLAREALSNGDKILSENYLQHADHFTRVLNDKESFRRDKHLENRSENNFDVDNNNAQNSKLNSNKDLEETSSDGKDAQKNLKTQVEIN